MTEETNKQTPAPSSHVGALTTEQIAEIIYAEALGHDPAEKSVLASGMAYAAWASAVRAANAIRSSLSPAPEKHVAAPQCCMCGKKNLSTVEGDGGSECELEDGRWVCSAVCWDRAVEPAPEKHVRVITLDWKDVSDERECHQARPPIGPVYWIEDDGFSAKKLGVRAHQLCLGNADDLDEAKALAQADFESRVLSAIVIGASR